MIYKRFGIAFGLLVAFFWTLRLALPDFLEQLENRILGKKNEG